MKYRVSWLEYRCHDVEVEAEDEFDAIEKAAEFDYGDTASDTSWYEDHSAKPVE